MSFHKGKKHRLVALLPGIYLLYLLTYTLVVQVDMEGLKSAILHELQLPQNLQKYAVSKLNTNTVCISMYKYLGVVIFAYTYCTI